MMKIWNKKTIMKRLCSALFIVCISVPSVVFGQDHKFESPRIEQYIRITDTVTGEIERVQIPNSSVEVAMTRGSQGSMVCDLNVDFDTLIEKKTFATLSNDTTQTVETYLEGHNGAVRIGYTNDGTFARLDSFTARWYKDSGAVTVKECSANYGQVLATNSKNGYHKMTGYGLQVNNTGFSLGKFGYNRNHFLGAVLNGVVGTKRIEVVNHVFF